jgi:hypothetical protein
MIRAFKMVSRPNFPENLQCWEKRFFATRTLCMGLVQFRMSACMGNARRTLPQRRPYSSSKETVLKHCHWMGSFFVLFDWFRRKAIWESRYRTFPTHTKSALTFLITSEYFSEKRCILLLDENHVYFESLWISWD